MNISELKNKLLKNPKFAEEYNKPNLALEVGSLIINARIRRGITQKDLAKLVKTHQPSIARLENGSSLPSLRFLEKIAVALKAKLRPPSFDFSESPREIFTNRSAEVSYSVVDIMSARMVPIELLNYNNAGYFSLRK